MHMLCIQSGLLLARSAQRVLCLGACEGMKKTIRELADKLSGIAKVGTVICDADGGKSPAMKFCTEAHAMQAFPVGHPSWQTTTRYRIVLRGIN